MRFIIVFIFTIFLALNAFGQKNFNQKKNSAENKPAPTFSVKDLKGKKLDLKKLKGKIVVLNFWFAECLPCLNELPNLNELVEEFKGKDVVFIAFTEDKADFLKKFLVKKPFNYQIIPASTAIIKNYELNLGGNSVMLYPTHILIDRDGKIEQRVSGLEGVKIMKKGIEKLLNEKKSK